MDQHCASPWCTVLFLHHLLPRQMQCKEMQCGATECASCMVACTPSNAMCPVPSRQNMGGHAAEQLCLRHTPRPSASTAWRSTTWLLRCTGDRGWRSGQSREGAQAPPEVGVVELGRRGVEAAEVGRLRVGPPARDTVRAHQRDEVAQRQAHPLRERLQVLHRVLRCAPGGIKQRLSSHPLGLWYQRDAFSAQSGSALRPECTLRASKVSPSGSHGAPGTYQGKPTP